jgi:hypothetical protein
MLPYAPNEACPFPPVNIFFKSFPAIPQSDEAQRVNVHFFAPLSPNAAPKRDRARGIMEKRRVKCVCRWGRCGSLEARGMYHPPLPFPFPYTLHYTLHPTPCTLHYTLHTAHYTLHYTLHPTPCTTHCRQRWPAVSVAHDGRRLTMLALPNTPPGGGGRTSGGVG